MEKEAFERFIRKAIRALVNRLAFFAPIRSMQRIVEEKTTKILLLAE